MYSIVISDDARLDIIDAYIYYAEQVLGLESEFEKSLDEGIQKVLKNPLQFPIKCANVRVHFIKRFPFGIHYLIEGYEVRVIAVFHTSRNPSTWMIRS